MIEEPQEGELYRRLVIHPDENGHLTVTETLVRFVETVGHSQVHCFIHNDPTPHLRPKQYFCHVDNFPLKVRTDDVYVIYKKHD